MAHTFDEVERWLGEIRPGSTVQPEWDERTQCVGITILGPIIPRASTAALGHTCPGPSEQVPIRRICLSLSRERPYLGLFLTIGGRRVPSTAGPSVWSIECEPVDHLPAPRHSHSLGDGGGQADHTRSSVNPYSQVTMRRNWSFPDGNIGIVRWAGRTSSSSTRSRSFRARPRQFARLTPQCRSCEPRAGVAGLGRSPKGRQNELGSPRSKLSRGRTPRLPVGASWIHSADEWEDV
jgi:hypothetical protein